jgi:hypothetical protein
MDTSNAHSRLLHTARHLSSWGCCLAAYFVIRRSTENKTIEQGTPMAIAQSHHATYCINARAVRG